MFNWNKTSNGAKTGKIDPASIEDLTTEEPFFFRELFKSGLQKFLEKMRKPRADELPDVDVDIALIGMIQNKRPDWEGPFFPSTEVTSNGRSSDNFPSEIKNDIK